MFHQHVIGTEPLQRHHQYQPDKQNKRVLQNGNGAVVNHAAHNTAKNKVLNLIDRGRRGKVSLTTYVDGEHQ